MLHASAHKCAACWFRGALFWQWDADEQGQFGPFAVQTNDATYSELIRPHAQRLRGMGGGLVGQCVPGGSRSFQVVPNPAGGRAPFLTGARPLRAAVRDVRPAA